MTNEWGPVIPTLPEYNPIILEPDEDIKRMPKLGDKTIGERIYDGWNYIKDLFWTLPEKEKNDITSAPRQGGKKESKEDEKAGGKYPLFESDYYDPVKALAYKNLFEDVENSGFKITYKDLNEMLKKYGSIGYEKGNDIYIAGGLPVSKDIDIISHEWIAKEYDDHEGNHPEICRREKKMVKSYLEEARDTFN